jgi:sarcosine oxidase subunit alpha
MRLKHIDRTPVSFLWNGKSIEAREGDSAAAALYAAGIRTSGWSRKFHRPLGLSGPVIGGILARVDGIPNVRLDQTIVAQGMRIEMQNVRI